MIEPTITLHAGDNRESLRRLIDQGVQVHSVVTDPPYGLTSITKRFGKGNAAPALSNGATGVFKRASGGFMGQQWDGSGIERDPEFWKLIHDILLPGGYVLAFSSPRTGHWQACAMDMAGFIMHPFFGWTYGSGFPKAHNAAMAIDKVLKVEGGRGEPKSAAHAGWIDRGAMRGDEGNEGWQRDWRADPEKVEANARKDVPGSDEAAQWEGWAYGAQSMKPALEPVYFGQKPFSEKNGALNLLKHGVGAVNIDGCRVPSPSKGIYGDSSAQDTHQTSGQSLGRHPANLIHDGSDEVKRMFPDTGKSGVAVQRNRDGEVHNEIYGAYKKPPAPDVGFNDSGSTSRFFNGFPFEADPLFYHAKATKADRAGSKHPTVKPVALMQHFVRLVTPPGGTVLDPFGGSGTTAEAARREGFDCILMEADDQYVADIRTRFNLPFENADEVDFANLFETTTKPAKFDNTFLHTDPLAENFESLFE